MRALLVSVLAVAAFPGVAFAAPDRTGAVSESAATYTWDGATASGAHTAGDPAACSHNPDTYCDQTLIEVKAPEGSLGDLKVGTGSYSGPHCTPLDAPRGPCDFSLRLYSSDATGKPIKELGTSGADSGKDELITYRKATKGFYLVVVFYYSVVEASYKGTATLSNLKLPAAAPPATTPRPPAEKLASALEVAGKAKVRTGVSTLVRCSVACRGELVAEISAAQARKLKLGKRKLVVSRSAVLVDTPSGATFVLRFKGRVARALARARTVKLTIRATLTDSAGAQKQALRASTRLAR